MDWKTTNFRPDQAMQLKKSNHFLLMSSRANRGEGQHVVCHECHKEHSKAQKRSKNGVLSEDVLIQSCHHELHNLQLCDDVWWST